MAVVMKRGERDRYANDKKRKADKGSQKRGAAPSIHVGEDFDVKIEEIGHNGDGVVKIEGYTVFVKNTEVGEEVKIKINKVLRTIAWATRQN